MAIVILVGVLVGCIVGIIYEKFLHGKEGYIWLALFIALVGISTFSSTLLPFLIAEWYYPRKIPANLQALGPIAMFISTVAVCVISHFSTYLRSKP